ncbi:MAG: phosphatidylglycerol lysyltransferase domain-containing protein [Proteiniphilum sp.]|nr:phosphatidylglycerol lysyltransferase domain-containing protein [Proteiniphilum sp.]MDD4416448.1 phosphatidylglycerol lysyltransferase domain-containing protein [Proteiniphilum sp.]
MLTFKTIELKDRDIINSYLKKQNYRASDLCFTNLFTWGKKFNTQFAVSNNLLFIRFRDNNNRNSYLKPVGLGDIKEGIEMIIDDHKQFDSVFQIRGVTKEMISEIEEAMPGRFEYNLNRSVSDYIYTTEKLIHLKGKKLQSKRNHINRFKRENEWQYKSLTGNSALVEECKSMLDKWMKINGEEKDPSLVYDDYATTQMLYNFEYLNLMGGLICVNSEIVAFSIGEKLTQDTVVVHVEKAFTTTHGAYNIINQQFVENEASEFTYVNREEDMGIDNLRQAKLSYQPDIILEKYNARFKS